MKREGAGRRCSLASGERVCVECESTRTEAVQARLAKRPSHRTATDCSGASHAHCVLSRPRANSHCSLLSRNRFAAHSPSPPPFPLPLPSPPFSSGSIDCEDYAPPPFLPSSSTSTPRGGRPIKIVDSVLAGQLVSPLPACDRMLCQHGLPSAREWGLKVSV